MVGLCWFIFILSINRWYQLPPWLRKPPMPLASARVQPLVAGRQELLSRPGGLRFDHGPGLTSQPLAFAQPDLHLLNWQKHGDFRWENPHVSHGKPMILGASAPPKIQHTQHTLWFSGLHRKTPWFSKVNQLSMAISNSYMKSPESKSQTGEKTWRLGRSWT